MDASMFTDDEKALIVFYGYGDGDTDALTRTAIIQKLRAKKGSAIIIDKLSRLSDVEYRRISVELLDWFVADLGLA